MSRFWRRMHCGGDVVVHREGLLLGYGQNPGSASRHTQNPHTSSVPRTACLPQLKPVIDMQEEKAHSLQPSARVPICSSCAVLAGASSPAPSM